MVVIPLGAGLGAYVGSFAGTMAKVRAGRYDAASVEHPVEPRGGRMIAVNVDRPDTERKAIEILRRHAARDVRRAEGELGRTAPGATSTRAPRSPPSSTAMGPAPRTKILVAVGPDNRDRLTRVLEGHELVFVETGDEARDPARARALRAGLPRRALRRVADVLAAGRHPRARQVPQGAGAVRARLLGPHALRGGGRGPRPRGEGADGKRLPQPAALQRRRARQRAHAPHRRLPDPDRRRPAAHRARHRRAPRPARRRAPRGASPPATRRIVGVAVASYRKISPRRQTRMYRAAAREQASMHAMSAEPARPRHPDAERQRDLRR